MSKKFLMLDENRITLIHNMPFDPVNGMGKTEVELQQMGVLIDDIPEPELKQGKIPIPCYEQSKGIYYEYENAPAQPATTVEIEALNAKIDYVAMMTEVL